VRNVQRYETCSGPGDITPIKNRGETAVIALWIPLESITSIKSINDTHAEREIGRPLRVRSKTKNTFFVFEKNLLNDWSTNSKKKTVMRLIIRCLII
jgi:hypothetical protein